MKGSIFLHFPRFTQTRQKLTKTSSSSFFCEVLRIVLHFPFTQRDNKLTKTMFIAQRKPVPLNNVMTPTLVYFGRSDGIRTKKYNITTLLVVFVNKKRLRTTNVANITKKVYYVVIKATKVIL